MKHHTEEQAQKAEKNSKDNEEDNGDFPVISVIIEMLPIVIPAVIVIFFLWKLLQLIGWL